MAQSAGDASVMEDTMRSVLAFLIAPLVVPAPYVISAIYYSLVDPWPGPSFLMFLAGITALITYGGVISLGIPAYLLLRSLGLTAFWIAPVTGFIVGAITDWVAIVYFLPSALANRLLREMAFAGVYGAVVGVILWLIARPDRQTQANA
jgi:hypothetical protein